MGNRQGKDTVLKRAIRHPRRLGILGFLARSEIGCEEAELAKELGEPLSRLKYHLKILQGAGLVAHVGDGKAAARYAVAAHS